MKKYFRSAFTILLFATCAENFAQTNSMPPPVIRDRYDTLISVINTTFAANQEYSFIHNGGVNSGNNILIYGDSILITPNFFSSYIQKYNPSTNSLTTLNFQRFSSDRGISSGVSIATPTNNLTYSFFGTKIDQYTNTDSILLLYKHNSLTDVISTETIQTQSGDNRKGVLTMGFFSPQSNHDTLYVFNHMGYGVYYDSVEVLKKHYNQTGVMNTYIKLPMYVDNLFTTFVYNNVMYVSGRGFSGDSYLFNSTDGMTFSLNAGYAASSFNSYHDVVQMDTLNGVLYLGVDVGDGDYKILKTNDGINYSEFVSQTQGYVASMKNFKDQLYYIISNSGQTGIPQVKYFHPNESIIMSHDSLGNVNMNASSFNIQINNNRFFVSGSYQDYTNNHYGSKIYELIFPVANFSVSGTTLCMNTPYTFVNQSANADSVRWYINNNFYVSTANNFMHSFTVPGSYTLGLIAISGTQQDSIQFVINIYSVTINVNPSITGCLNNKITITPTVPGAVPPINYNWSVSSALTQTSLTNANVIVSTSVSGTYTYVLSVSDANGCSAYGATGNLTINPNKDLNGAVDVAAIPLTGGNVILYKYEPVLTKFDSVTYQPLNASGTFTFSLADAHTYILKCEPSSSTLLITYAPSETSWKTATVVNHGCINGTNQNINVVPLLNIGTGPGMLTGKVVEGQKYGGKGTAVAPGNPISGLTIKGGKNPGGGIVAQGRTNSAGEYTISNLPTNVAGESYFILVDVPGLDTNNTYHKAITSASLQINGLDFVVDSAKINPIFVYASVNEININNDVIKIFPNPTNGLLNIQFALDKPQTIEIVLSDITGKEVRSIMPSQQLFNKEVKLQTQLNDLNQGVYLIKLKIGDAERTTRVVITN